MLGKMQTMDGNTAAAYVAYAFTDVAAIYPITPSSDMAEHVDEWSANGRKNIFGQKVLVTELQSEAGAAGAVHGALTAGALSSTYTASQGLLLMIPNMYKIAGELQPGVFHVAARALSTHALSIFGDHQDVMAARQTGFAMIASGSVQEVMDLGGIAHLAAIKSSVPFLHFFDGFRTSHELQKIEVMDYDDFSKLVDYEAVENFRKSSLNPEHPVTKGTAQNPDIYFQGVEASNIYYDKVPDIVNDYMKDINKITAREYKPFNYIGHPEAERIIVAMGSVTETIEETVDYLVERGEKVGAIKVRLYRPFSAKYFFDVLPCSVKKIAVLDRTKEKGAVAEPLHLDVKSIFFDSKEDVEIVGGRYGLASKDTTPSQILAVFENLKKDKPKDRFTIGIIDDVTNTSLEISENISSEPKDRVRCKFWGFGSDGTVGANKQAIKIIGDNTDMYVQAYFSYDSKKSGGVTVSHLRFGKSPIKSTYLISKADFVSCSKQSYLHQYDILKGLRKGGTFLLNTIWEGDDLENNLPGNVKKYIYDNDISFYTINATKIASEVGLGGRTNMVMQAAFFKLAEIIPVEEAVEYLKKSIKDEYGAKGDDIVNMNYRAVDKGIESLVKVEVKEEWKYAKKDVSETNNLPSFIKGIKVPMDRQEGDSLPVSAFIDKVRGEIPSGTAAYEKRGVAVEVPMWKKENCIQCNQCSLVCPHAAIRPFLLDEEESNNKPEVFETIDAKGKGLESLEFRIQISTLDCTGCGNCAEVCPSKNKALEMVPFEHENEVQASNWEYAIAIGNKEDRMDQYSIKGSQFKQPLLQFSGACAGCGETPYAKLITQLYGDRMLISNASGCSSIWGGSSPSSSFCPNQEGKGPAWASSLFEDNAEYGYGMALANRKIREKVQLLMEEFIDLDIDPSLNSLFKEWIEGINDPIISKKTTKGILPLLNTDTKNKKANELLREIYSRKDYLVKKSVWVFGGDGWAYDIGYGGLDHVLASGEDINILVMDTEVYSNTGGQSSKATPTAAVAKFAASGKKLRKKDLGMMAASYGYVYVAQIALGANMNQAIKALKEAESYNGPSIIIAYAPCINHGIRTGMGTTIRQEKRAVNSGYWHLYRFDPRLKEEGKNPFQLDSKEPTESFMDFINSEIRYTSLRKTFPDIADILFTEAEKDAKEKYEKYVNMAK
jgi:pyruvate-ferredoxin/flavodoxin oxidoreductase